MMDSPGLTTSEIMTVALEMAGMQRIPDDSAVYVEGQGLRRVMMGVDIGAAELLLARQLGVDGVIAHHPAGGAATLRFPKVLGRQVELMVEAGVLAEEARNVVQPAIARGMLRAQTANFDHIPSSARLLGMPFLNVHLPLDEVGRRIMVRAIERHTESLGRESTVADIVEALNTIPEIRNAPTGVMVPVGRLDWPAGRVAVFHGAGTNGGFPVAQALAGAGISTVIYIHVAAEDADRLRALGLEAFSLVVSGHIASDLIGINLFVAELERRGIEVIRMSGL